MQIPGDFLPLWHQDTKKEESSERRQGDHSKELTLPKSSYLVASPTSGACPELEAPTFPSQKEPREEASSPSQYVFLDLYVFYETSSELSV